MTVLLVRKIEKYSVALAVVGMFSGVLEAQVKTDPRSVSMGGATTTVADGIYAVGINPANLSMQIGKPFMLQLSTLNIGFVNNWLSLDNFMALSGVNLEAQNQRGKKAIYDEIGDGLRFFRDLHLAIPLVNYASGNMAITNDIVYVSDFTFPKDMFRLFLDGNPPYEVLDMSMKYETLALLESAFSFAVPFEKFSLGFTVKYLRGLVYLGLDPDSTYYNVTTEPSGFIFDGQFYLRQGRDGRGIGADIGFLTREINGWRFGMSIINFLGKIKWTSSGSVDENSWSVAPWNEIKPGTAKIWTFSDTVSANTIQDSLFPPPGSESSGIAGVMKGLLEGKVRFVPDTAAFTLRYPAMFRLGFSRKFDEDLLISSDLVAGFDDRLNVRNQWIWSIGLQFSRFKSIPIRVGYTWGGRHFNQTGFGIGLEKGPIMMDFAFAFRNGIWVNSMKGLTFSMAFALTSFKGRKEKAEPGAEEGPLPEPETEVNQIQFMNYVKTSGPS